MHEAQSGSILASSALRAWWSAPKDRLSNDSRRNDLSFALRVLLITNFPPDQQHSMLRYARLLEEQLKSAGVEVSVATPKARLSRMTMKGSRLWKGLAAADKFLLFGVELWFHTRRFHKAGCGVIHLLDQGNGILLPCFAKFAHVVTCHDLIALKAGAKRSLFQRWNARCLSMAKWLACVSGATRMEALQILGLPSEKCVVIHNPLPPFFQEPAGPAPEGAPAHYLLHVGSGSFYKNRPGLLRIYAALCSQGCELPLVIMGEPLRSAEMMLAEELGLMSRLHVRAHPSDTEIRAGYAHATALLFPSLEEGFGWPILEALAQGCLVFTTGRAPMTEVGGDAAVYLDLEDEAGCARQILQFLQDEWEQKRRRELGLAHVANFNVEKFAQDWLELYSRVLEEYSQTAA